MHPVQWNRIDTVLLDMDGTVLDLHFDNHFWREHVPLRYAEHHSLPVDEAKKALMPIYRAVEGTLDWYCVDYWTRELGLDIAALKREVADRIRIHPGVPAFLEAVRASGRRLLLVTNAHRKSLLLKLEITGIERHFHEIVCAHDLGMPKEHGAFWPALQRIHPFTAERTLFADDSPNVLASAQDFGIGQIVAIRNPDSRDGPRDIAGFTTVNGLGDLLPVE